MNLRFVLLLALLPLGWCEAAKVTINETAVNDGDGSPIGAVSASQFVEIGTLHTTVTAPTTWSSYRFTHWTFDGEPATVFRDPWGRSKNPISFPVAVAASATAHYLPATRDSDGDSLPDWYEIEYFGDLSRTAGDDGDGDGITLLAEYTAGSSPVYANNFQEGGVAWADSGLVTCNLAGYPTYTLRSNPAGTVNQSAVVAPGTVVTVPDLSGNASFGYWELDGVRQQDAWGRAITSLSFIMVASTDREAVAYLFTGDGDGDGVPDAYEHRYYGGVSNDGTSDTDGDGITLLAEYTAGSSPIYSNSSQEGGVAWADSALVTADLQAEIAVELAGSGIDDGGSRAFGTAVVGNTTSLTFTIRNVGGTALTGLGITLTGGDAARFSVTGNPTAPVLHNGSTSFTIQFAPIAPGARTVALQIASNDANENPFDITLTSQAVLSFTTDTDHDGMNDASEFQMAAMGFDWEVGQPELVATYFANSHLNNLFRANQVQALRVPSPILARQSEDGHFMLKFPIQKSTDLLHFSPFPVTPSQASVNPDGQIEFRFNPTDDSAFFRIEAE